MKESRLLNDAALANGDETGHRTVAREDTGARDIEASHRNHTFQEPEPPGTGISGRESNALETVPARSGISHHAHPRPHLSLRQVSCRNPSGNYDINIQIFKENEGRKFP